MYILNEKGSVLSGIILYSAFTWLCPKCKKRNYIKGKIAQLTDEDKEEIREEMGVKSWEQGEDIDENEYLTIPDEVVCKKCFEHYDVENYW